MRIIALLISACAHAAGDATFRPWALNDSTAFVFPRIAEKRNRARRERLAAALSKECTAPSSRLEIEPRHRPVGRERKQTKEASIKLSRTAPAAPRAGGRIWLKRARSGTGPHTG